MEYIDFTIFLSMSCAHDYVHACMVGLGGIRKQPGKHFQYSISVTINFIFGYAPWEEVFDNVTSLYLSWMRQEILHHSSTNDL